jgi:hypothetical protein
MKFMYLVRRDEEWHKGYNYSQILGTFLRSKRMAEFWDSVFTTTWIDFRIKLDKIRNINQKDLTYDIAMSTYEIKSPEQLRGYVVVPCDDDDWLRGDIFDILREECNLGQYNYRWNFLELSIIENGFYELRSWSYPTNVQFPIWRLSYNYQSNNYAVLSPKSFSVVDSHGVANNVLDVRQEKFIPQDLSVHNGNLASLTFMKRTEMWYNGDLRYGLVDMHKRFKTNPVTNVGVSSYYDKYVDMMMDLYENLKVK